MLPNRAKNFRKNSKKVEKSEVFFQPPELLENFNPLTCDDDGAVFLGVSILTTFLQTSRLFWSFYSNSLHESKEQGEGA
jgi:hypothetical protein